MSSSGHRKTRQRSNVIFGWIGVALGAVLMIGGVRGGSVTPMSFFGAVLAILGYLVMVQPFLQSRGESLIVHNILREVTLPWGGISHASSRGSLTLHDNDGGKTTVWAIGSQKGRVTPAAEGSKRRATLGISRPGSSDELLAGPTSAAALREVINAETVDNPEGPSGKSVRWLPRNCGLLALAVVLLAIGIVL